jgi:hypothetical protein
MQLLSVISHEEDLIVIITNGIYQSSFVTVTAPVMFSNQTDPTGKFMNLVIAQSVITQVRYRFSMHMVFEVVACLLCSIYILVLF